MTVFNKEEALASTAGDQELLRQVLRFTLEDLPPLLGEAAALLRSASAAELARTAHKIKGSAAACGAEKMYLAALELETAARDAKDIRDENPGFQNLYVSLEKSFEEFSKDGQVLQLASLDADSPASIG